MSDELKRIADRLDDLVERVERFLPPGSTGPDWKASAFRWEWRRASRATSRC